MAIPIRQSREPGGFLRVAVVCLLVGASASLAGAIDARLRTAIEQAWGQTPQAVRAFDAANAALKAGKDAEAANGYREALQASPRMLQALVALTLLQASSNDPAVRSPADATANSTKATNVLQDIFQLKITGKLPDTKDLHLSLLLMKAQIFHGVAAARSAAGDFARAVQYGGVALHAAQTLDKESPGAEHARLTSAIQADLAVFQSNQALHGVKPLPIGVLE